ncbi:protein kinase domain-containing protein [Fastidiosibacter lacustris]|uniref:protein kinase domain-containing protein n=1 Tax=Fastidiosibacter lacustris TaxID=2056695 RepID=UPI000E34DDB2|nr:protein kinase family protein [Fastidiosibacter lacustris]
MPYPSLENYQEALQNPKGCFSDHELKYAIFKKTGLGVPLALCGGFALTYIAQYNHKKYAIRCFHKESKSLEARYAEISKNINKLNSNYFLNFDFIANGILVKGKKYPIIKMDWANGETLGEFIENNLNNPSALIKLNQSLLGLNIFLEKNNIAHGDIQIDNLIVNSSDYSVKLIDYDGMFFEGIKNLGSAELGQRNFQHPEREKINPYDNKLDRFSFISLSLAIDVLQKRPDIWNESASGDAIVFKANDFRDPESSKIFNSILRINELEDKAKWFMSICKSSYLSIPTLSDFLNGCNIPTSNHSLTPFSEKNYIAAFPVVDATDYNLAYSLIGTKVELIGKIHNYKSGTTTINQPYVFLNFSSYSKGKKMIKIVVWNCTPNDIKRVGSLDNLVSKWISVSGMFLTHKSAPNQIQMELKNINQLFIMNEQDAKFRLNKTKAVIPNIKDNNKGILDDLKHIKNHDKTISKITSFPQQSNKNISLLNDIKSMKNTINKPQTVSQSTIKNNGNRNTHFGQKSPFSSNNSHNSLSKLNTKSSVNKPLERKNIDDNSTKIFFFITICIAIVIFFWLA